VYGKQFLVRDMRLLWDFVSHNDANEPSLRGVPTTKQSRILDMRLPRLPLLSGLLVMGSFFRHCERSEAISYLSERLLRLRPGADPRNDV